MTRFQQICIAFMGGTIFTTLALLIWGLRIQKEIDREEFEYQERKKLWEKDELTPIRNHRISMYLPPDVDLNEIDWSMQKITPPGDRRWRHR